MARAGASGEFAASLNFAEVAIAVRAIESAGIVVRAIRHAGESTVIAAIAGVLTRQTRPDRSVVLDNCFRWATATRGQG